MYNLNARCDNCGHFDRQVVNYVTGMIEGVCFYSGAARKIPMDAKSEAVQLCSNFVQPEVADGTYIIKIPEVPPSNNKYIGHDQRWQYAAAKKEWCSIIGCYIKNPPEVPINPAEVHIHYEFGDRRRRDPDNYSGKFILDALTHYGIIHDDNFGCIRLVLTANPTNKALISKEKQTIITVRPFINTESIME
ncbi:MAG: hypothetical protein RR614_07420 [Eubacterium sp.]